MTSSLRISRRSAFGLAATGLIAAHRILADEPKPAEPKGRIVFHASRGEPQFQGLYAVDVTSDVWEQLSVGISGYEATRISPDGRWIALLHDVPADSTKDSGSWVHDLTGEQPPRKVSDVTGRRLWSPDSGELIVSGKVLRDDPTRQTWRVSRDGLIKTRLDIPENELVIDWSRDGRLLLTMIESPAKDGTWVYRTRDAQGANPKIIDDSGSSARQSLAPNSQSVASIASQLPATDLNRGFDLEVLDLKSGRKRTLFKHTELATPARAIWSPDGQWLAVSMARHDPDDKENSSYGIEILTAEGTFVRRIHLPHTSPIPLDWC